MHTPTKSLSLLLIAFLIFSSSCSENNADTQEQTTIATMDSTSRVLKETNEKLEDQTRKVEESLEKLDKEFETTE